MPPDESGLAWRLVNGRRQSRGNDCCIPFRSRIARPLPEIDRVFAQTLEERDWDAIVFDSICSGWGIEAVLRNRARARRRPKLVHLAHNHEITVARRIADAARGARRLLKEIDALKIVRLERRLVAEADLVTSNSPEDRGKFVGDRRHAGGVAAARLRWSTCPFAGDRRPRPAPRRRRRQLRLAAQADQPRTFPGRGGALAAARQRGIADRGRCRAGLSRRPARAYPSVTFVRPVDDVRPYMARARIALVPDLLGGFRLKGLDYVFNPYRSCPCGSPCPACRCGTGEHRTIRQPRAPGQGIVQLIDDFAELNPRQMLAFDACAARFDWLRSDGTCCARLPGSIRLTRRPLEVAQTLRHPPQGQLRFLRRQEDEIVDEPPKRWRACSGAVRSGRFTGSASRQPRTARSASSLLRGRSIPR